MRNLDVGWCVRGGGGAGRGRGGHEGRWQAWGKDNVPRGGAEGPGGKLPPPPDPVVFAELKEIVEGRLKESLARYVRFVARTRCKARQ